VRGSDDCEDQKRTADDNGDRLPPYASKLAAVVDPRRFVANGRRFGSCASGELWWLWLPPRMNALSSSVPSDHRRSALVDTTIH
jgi:hypothetical protein